MQRFWLTVGLAGLILSSCGPGPQSRTASLQDEPRGYWEEIAPACAGHPSKSGCNDGDMTLFGGLLCASGDERGCALVRDAQGADGAWWRSPRRNPGNLGEHPSFSRDMAMGVLLYLATTRDGAAATRWLTWIEANRPCLEENPWGGCMILGPHRFCRDETAQTCTLTPGNWSLMGRVWEALGLAKTAEMRAYAGIDSDTLWMQAQSAPIGYALHLNGVEVLLKQRLDAARDTREKATAILAARQPDNLFFTYLKRGPSAGLTAQLYARCPAPGARDGGSRSQWSWERDTSDGPWRDSMGWDCLFLENLLTHHG